jgi:hypothetical protein
MTALIKSSLQHIPFCCFSRSFGILFFSGAFNEMMEE